MNIKWFFDVFKVYKFLVVENKLMRHIALYYFVFIYYKKTNKLEYHKVKDVLILLKVIYSFILIDGY